jgi:hypothetical protein
MVLHNGQIMRRKESYKRETMVYICMYIQTMYASASMETTSCASLSSALQGLRSQPHAQTRLARRKASDTDWTEGGTDVRSSLDIVPENSIYQRAKN